MKFDTLLGPIGLIKYVPLLVHSTSIEEMLFTRQMLTLTGIQICMKQFLSNLV